MIDYYELPMKLAAHNNGGFALHRRQALCPAMRGNCFDAHLLRR